jgi:hypothetical protein
MLETDNTEDRDQLEEENTELKKVEKNTDLTTNQVFDILTRFLERINLHISLARFSLVD